MQQLWVAMRCQVSCQSMSGTFARSPTGWNLTSLTPLPAGGSEAGALAADGAFGLDPTYSGCQSCGADSYFKCTCGRLSCWRSAVPMVTCPWCGHQDRVAGSIDSVTALDGG